MARILGEARHTLAIQDPVSGSVITLMYRRPTSEERVAYQVSAFRLEGGERRFCLGETRLRFGLEILTGFGAGDFLITAEEGEIPLDPDRHPDWKARLAEDAPDLVSYLAQQVFEGMRVASRGEPEWD
ncbi:MAG: hypothetical protein M0P73_05100 [Syntrophobacterales bacterium]|jgi:hypothetical protein|nr:hypothetical protein [Syntrophobacterales bacterium]